ncbi:MAG: CBS domain-containing protein [Ignavibacteriales bacterium]|nr:CBS domain-containing protein [Ignavibacteriales bacterium]
MTQEVYGVHHDTTAEECMALMTDKHIRHLPVCKDGKLAGIISIGDVVKAIIDRAEGRRSRTSRTTSWGSINRALARAAPETASLSPAPGEREADSWERTGQKPGGATRSRVSREISKKRFLKKSPIAVPPSTTGIFEAVFLTGYSRSGEGKVSERP